MITLTATREFSPTSARGLGLVIDVAQLASARAAVQSLGVSAWARSHGFRPKAVFDVLSGTRPCIRGKSHDIAVALGLKTTATAPVQP